MKKHTTTVGASAKNGWASCAGCWALLVCVPGAWAQAVTGGQPGGGTVYAPVLDVPTHALKAPGAEPDTEALPPADGKSKWVLGMTLSSSPSYAGATDRQLSFRPVVAARLGRWMVSTSSARRMAGMPLAGGISTTVVAADRWQLGVGLRLTHGRDSADNALLTGLPDVARSVALRASANWVLTPEWRVTGGVQQDLLRSQGLNANLGLGWSRRLDAGWTLDAGTGVSWVNAQAMNTFYGVPLSQARPGRSAWQPGAGLEQWHWGVGLSRALSAHWRLSTSVGRSTLLGAAAHSPLTLQRSGTTAQIGVAYVGW